MKANFEFQHNWYWQFRAASQITKFCKNEFPADYFLGKNQFTADKILFLQNFFDKNNYWLFSSKNYKKQKELYSTEYMQNMQISFLHLSFLFVLCWIYINLFSVDCRPVEHRKRIGVIWVEIIAQWIEIMIILHRVQYYKRY